MFIAIWQKNCYGIVMCKIAECQGRAVAQGLCAKHYMRMRRTGSPTKTGKPGRPRELNSYRAAIDQGYIPCTLSDTASPRTKARLAEALRILDRCSAEARIEAIHSCARSNGSINVSRLLEHATDLWWREHPDAT
jgi:hypothetical protein